MERPDLAPTGNDIERPNAARLYDYALGGSHNFAVDRELFGQLLTAMPDIGQIAQAAHGFVCRAVRFCVDAGIDQFLDLGWSGIPTRGKVHEIAHEARVMYVDSDPVGVELGRATLTGNQRVGVVQENLRQPERVLAHPEVTGLLDFDRPITILLGGMLSLLPDDDNPAGIVARLRDAMAPGSYMVLTHLTSDGRPEEVRRTLHLMRGGGIPAIPRTRAEVSGFFAGFDLVEPGLVWVSQWRPDSPDEADDPSRHSTVLGGVGRKS
jgi:S-adenosyl methyltransferase